MIELRESEMASRPKVFLLIQNPFSDAPAHRASLALCLQLVSAAIAKWVGETFEAIQLLTRETWRSIKDRFREREVSKTIPRINPHGYHTPCFMTSYPPTAYESDAKERRARLWLGAQKF